MSEWFSTKIGSILLEQNLLERTRQIVDDINRGNLNNVNVLPVFAELLETYAQALETIYRHMRQLEQSGLLDKSAQIMELLK